MRTSLPFSHSSGGLKVEASRRALIDANANADNAEVAPCSLQHRRDALVSLGVTWHCIARAVMAAPRVLHAEDSRIMDIRITD